MIRYFRSLLFSRNPAPIPADRAATPITEFTPDNVRRQQWYLRSVNSHLIAGQECRPVRCGGDWIDDLYRDFHTGN